MSKKRKERGSVLYAEESKLQNDSTRSRASVWLVVGLSALLLTVGVFAKNGWFPSADGLTGKKTGWFGKQVPNNASVSWNPLAAAPVQTPLPLSKEYIYAGSRLLAVEDANANATPPADLAIWRKSTGAWWVMSGSATGNYSNYYGDAWGTDGDDPVEGDYDGDGKTDFAVYRPPNPSSTNGSWYIVNSSTGGSVQFPFGTTGDLAVQADYDGDGRTDAAIYRPSTTTWYILQSSNGAIQHQFGLAGDKLAVADYDGDGRADLGVYRGTDASFHYLSSANNLAALTILFGQSGDFPVPADYDGDGRADAAVWRPGVYQWLILYSSNQTSEGFTFGDPNSDINVSNDYDADGKVDRAFWRPSEGKWYIVQSSKKGQPDELRTVVWGIPGDIPVPAYYRR